MDRLKSAAKRAGSMIKKGVKAVGKKAAKLLVKLLVNFLLLKTSRKQKQWQERMMMILRNHLV